MSNLGGYQRITTVSKALGGPGNAFAFVLGAGIVIGGAVVAGSGKLLRVTKQAAREAGHTRPSTAAPIYEATNDGENSDGLRIRAGDRFRVLDSDGDSVLIELRGDQGNPHFASRAFLSALSDFGQDGDETGS